MNILILEDEIPAYEKLIYSLSVYFENPFQHDWAVSNAEGKKLLINNTYDFILSDIKLLDVMSFDLFDEIEINTPILFCSAYDEFLFKAFQTNGIAYLLKPYSQEDFDQAIIKYQKLCQEGKYNTINTETISELKSVLIKEKTHYKERFVIKKPNGVELLNVKEISLIQASGDFCFATDITGERYMISNRISEISIQLNPQLFCKVNRSQIIHIKAIQNIKNYTKNRLKISLEGIDETVITSSSQTSTFRKWIEG